MNLQSVLLEKTSRTKPPTGQVVPQLPRDAFDVLKFTENFDVLVDTAGSAKHLRELVLKLAVSGQLSDASNETADSLLAELERQRLRLRKTGVRVGETSPPVTADETPYAIPSGWRWIRLRDLGGFLGGGTPSKSNASFWEGPLPWVSPKDMKRPHIDDAEDHISTAAVEGSAVKLIPAQSILYVVRGMILAHSFPVATTTREVTINQDMKALVLAMPSLSEFILRSCQAARTRVLAKVERSSHGTCRLESEAVEMLPIALPPLGEQKRIVARVDQLMALIDDLEAKQSKKRDLSSRFTKAALEAQTTAESPEAFDTAWQRVLQHFPMVFDRGESVELLRESILALAFAGALVPRDSDSKVRVADLLNLTSKERARLVSSGAIDKTQLPKMDEAEYRFPLPAGWELPKLDDVAYVVDPNPSHRNPLYTAGGFPFVSTQEFIGREGLLLDTPRRVAEQTIIEQESRCRLSVRSILFSRKGTIGKTRIFPGGCRVGLLDSLCVVNPFGAINVRYLNYALRSPQVRRQTQDMTRGLALPQISVGRVRLLRIPIASEAEQERIVCQIDQLMNLCDALEAKLRLAEDRASKLVEAVVQEMVT